MLPEFERNILATYYQATTQEYRTGMAWYSTARALVSQLAETYCMGNMQVAGIVAATSPGASWKQNLVFAERVCSHHKLGFGADECAVSCSSYGRANKVKAFRIAQGELPSEVLGGDKVHSFYLNLLCDTSGRVVIDRHAVSIAIGQPLGNKYTVYVNTPEKYRKFEKLYIKVADSLGIMPSQLQAICWVVWRRIHNNKVDKFMDV